MSYERELEVARAAAVRAGELSLRHQAKGVTPDTKADLSPVTIADRESEQLIARAFEEAFPDDGILGEEGGQKDAKSGRRWIIDPIDGTRDFLRGLPTWAVLLGLEDRGEVAAGVAHFPAQGVTWWAARGAGAWRNGERVGISKITDPAESLLCVNGLNETQRYAFGPRLLDWMRQFWAVRSFGGCQDAVMVAGGQAEAWLEPGGKPWDFAALKIIAEEAGASFFNFDGGKTIYGGNCVVCVPALERRLRELVCGDGAEPQMDPA